MRTHTRMRAHNARADVRSHACAREGALLLSLSTDTARALQRAYCALAVVTLDTSGTHTEYEHTHSAARISMSQCEHAQERTAQRTRARKRAYVSGNACTQAHDEHTYGLANSVHIFSSIAGTRLGAIAFRALETSIERSQFANVQTAAEGARKRLERVMRGR